MSQFTSELLEDLADKRQRRAKKGSFMISFIAIVHVVVIDRLRQSKILSVSKSGSME